MRRPAIRRLQSTKYQSRWLLVPARASSSVLLTGNRRRFSNGFKAKADRWMAGGIFAGRRNDLITRPEIRTAALPGQPIGKRVARDEQLRNNLSHRPRRHDEWEEQPTEL